MHATLRWLRRMQFSTQFHQSSSRMGSISPCGVLESQDSCIHNEKLGAPKFIQNVYAGSVIKRMQVSLIQAALTISISSRHATLTLHCHHVPTATTFSRLFKQYPNGWASNER
jgi:hypothetical protein